MDALMAMVPHGAEILAFVVALAALISAFIPDSAMPKPVAAILNALALNVGRAKNDPSVN